MKIAIIGHKRIPSNEGGIEKGVEQHAVRMVKRGHSVTAYNRGGHNVFGKEFDREKQKEYKGIRIVTIPTTKGAASVPIYSFLATIHAAFCRYDCVSFRASGSCAMIPLAKLLGLRVVASLHGIDSQRDKWGGFASKYLEFGEKMAATKADVCLVLSKNMKQYIDTKYGVDSVLFANGIDKPGNHDADIIKDNCQVTIAGGFAPTSGTADEISKSLGTRTVMTGSVSRSKNDPSQSLQMTERPLMTADELKSMKKGNFIIMKTGTHPFVSKLKLFFKWGIEFDTEKYTVPDKGARKVSYTNKEIIENNMLEQYPDSYYPQSRSARRSASGGQALSQSNEPLFREPEQSVRTD